MKVVMRTLFSKSERALLDQNQCFVLDSQSDDQLDTPRQGIPDVGDIYESRFAQTLLNGALPNSSQINFELEIQEEASTIQGINNEAQTQTLEDEEIACQPIRNIDILSEDYRSTSE